MSFACQPIEQGHFESLSDLHQWVEKNKRISRLPVEGLLIRKARFLADRFFGDDSHQFQFNRHAFGALCLLLGLPPGALFQLREPELASRVLNDLLASNRFRSEAPNFDFVVHDEDQTILGLVSKSYLSYPNTQFMSDLEGALRRQPVGGLGNATTADELTFHSAYVVNTQVYVRFLSEKHVGRIVRNGQAGEDITKIGLQCRNSLVGESSVFWEYFLYRLICTNGAVVPAGKSQQRVVHAGRCETFRQRLQDRLGSILEKIADVARLVEALGDIPFKPDALARTPGAQMALEVVPDLRHRVIQQFGRPDFRKKSGVDRQISRDAEYLQRIPDVILGPATTSVFASPRRSSASMFDLVNVFTEFAQTVQLKNRMGIEERAGSLAAWIVENRQKLY